MREEIEARSEDFGGAILPSQYNDLLRRRWPTLDGEYRLLWAVLEDAIRTYLANSERSNVIQRRKFEEVRNWFEPRGIEPTGALDFQTVCEVLGLEPSWLLMGLKRAARGESSLRRHRLRRGRGRIKSSQTHFDQQ